MKNNSDVRYFFLTNISEADIKIVKGAILPLQFRLCNMYIYIYNSFYPYCTYNRGDREKFSGGLMSDDRPLMHSCVHRDNCEGEQNGIGLRGRVSVAHIALFFSFRTSRENITIGTAARVTLETVRIEPNSIVDRTTNNYENGPISARMRDKYSILTSKVLKT